MSGTSARRAFLLSIAIAALAAGTLDVARGAGEGHSHGTTNAPTESRLQTGATLIEARRSYQELCASCHGPRGQGSAAVPVNFSDPSALVRLTRDNLTRVLDRRHEGRLPASLPELDRHALADYVRNYLMLPAPDADTEMGRAIYARSCSVCHGDRGDGTSWAMNSLYPAPADFTEHGLESVSREKMIDAVSFGKDNTAMMPFAVQLSREEIAATVDYIRAAFMKEGHGHGSHRHDHQEASHGHADAAFPGNLIGDAAWGREFFDANCAECHGTTGNGQGKRAYFMLVKPKNFRGDEARASLDRAKLFEQIGQGVTGTTMPAWNKVLDPQQIANVAEYVYRAFLHPEQFGEAQPLTPDSQPSGDQSGLKKN